MKKRNKKIIFAVLLFASVLFILNFVSSQEITYCAEKTKSGAWCQNVPLNEVDTSLRYVPTSCEATSYCKLGTCVNSQEGVCLENTPQRVCESPTTGTAGLWQDANAIEIPQCRLGCCLIGDQAAFTTQTRCTQLSSLYGLETNYRKDITSEIQCIASAGPRIKGACVFEEEFQRTCKMVTRSECQGLESTGTISAVEFHEGILCSAEELGTICGPSRQTTLVDGRDEVFFTDTCGNVANIYDASRQGDAEYWNRIVLKSQSCNLGTAGARSCGNCDYLAGSTGKLYNRATDGNAPEFGNYLCRDLNCRFESVDYLHGETWCASPETVSASNAKGVSEIRVEEGEIVDLSTNPSQENLAGSRYFRMVCYNGDVTVEPCADFRNEVCIQDSIGDFSTAACRVNKWQDCTAQTTEANCMNTDARDCQWIGESVLTFSARTILGATVDEDTSRREEGICLPRYAPGQEFWNQRESTESLCLQASETCVARFERRLVGDSDYECVENCHCIGGGVGGQRSSGLSAAWLAEKNNQCLALGDCGANVNYIGEKGYDDGSGRVLVDGERHA